MFDLVARDDVIGVVDGFAVEIARQAVTFLKTGEAINALNLPRQSAEEIKKSFEFVNLATILGKVLVGLASQPIERLEVALFGRAAEVESRPISVAALVGILGGQFSTPVNRVNAENIARRQGISLIESGQCNWEKSASPSS